jgi:hypothetical protein
VVVFKERERENKPRKKTTLRQRTETMKKKPEKKERQQKIIDTISDKIFKIELEK